MKSSERTNHDPQVDSDDLRGSTPDSDDSTGTVGKGVQDEGSITRALDVVHGARLYNEVHRKALPEDIGSVMICNVGYVCDSRDTNHYHCSSCGRITGMFGCLTQVDGEWIMSCDPTYLDDRQKMEE